MTDVIDPHFHTAVEYPAPVCHEDEPCWDCHTMGNLICGSDTQNSSTVITATTTVPPAGGLPVTGGDVTGLLFLGTGAFIIGALLVRTRHRSK